MPKDPGALEALAMASPSDVLQFFEDHKRVQEQAKWAKSTLRQYASQWAMFVRWCEREGRTPMPASVSTLRAFVYYESERLNNRGGQRRVVGIRQALAAIRFSHHLVRKVAPIHHPDVQSLIAERRRVNDIPVEPAEAVTVHDLLRIISTLGANVPMSDGLHARNRAMLAIGFAGALRPGEIVRLQWGDAVVHHGAGVMLDVHAVRGKAESLETIMLPMSHRHPLICPVAALTAWRAACPHPEPTWPMFGMSESDIAFVLKLGAASSGIATRFTASSLRVGWATAAAESGATLPMIMLHMRCGVAAAARFFGPPAWATHPSAGVY